MKNTVVISCDNKYVPKAIVALKQFCSYNPTFNKVIIGTKFGEEMTKLCQQYNIKIYEVDLSSDFINLDKRKYGSKYPIECFHYMYAYKLLLDSDYIVKIEPDIHTNKPLNINLKDVKYIAGSYQTNHYIKNYSPIIQDYDKIKSAYGPGDINQRRIIGGVVVFNVKGLNSIKFYEKIVDYYKKSWIIDAPRCGDDSLMVMYQLLNPYHVFLFNPSFHVIGAVETDIKYYKDITFFHSGPSTLKYWNMCDISNYTFSNRYFLENIIEYIYNNFPLYFIKTYIPNIYLDVSNVKIPFYYFNMNNFGDIITPYFLKKFCSNDDYSITFSENSPKIISCGSIFRVCNNKTLVYGSGIRDIDQNINNGIIKLVRGPLTRRKLLDNNCYCPEEYGDPGLLLPTYYFPKIDKKYTLGIIPHYVHYNAVKKMYENDKNIKVINLLNPNIELVINDILSCAKIVSSSLHGLIVSDAYNIPNKWVMFNDMIKGDNTKFYDYFNSVNRADQSYIDCNNYKKLPSNVSSMVQNVNIKFNFKRLKEKMFFNEKGIKNYTKYLYLKYIITNDSKENNYTKCKIITNKSNIKNIKNTYLAYKYHWELHGKFLISNRYTYLKSSTKHSDLLSSSQKVFIQKKKCVILIDNYNSDYYSVSEIK
jgi:pyruvyltransferase